jgi:methyl-accepting chemotaxis protein
MDLNMAIQKHAQWKFKFQSSLLEHQSGSKTEPLDVATISKDNCCEFGAWLHGSKYQYQQLPVYVKCIAAHAEFHVEAGKIAAAINAKKVADAERMMAANSAFAEVSKKVGVAIIELKNQVGA